MNKLFNEHETWSQIAVPKFMQGDTEWQDTSWHNDATASAQLELKGKNIMRVWVLDDNPELREFTDMPKFMVEIDDEYGDNILPGPDYYRTAETEEELEKIVNELLKEYDE